MKSYSFILSICISAAVTVGVVPAAFAMEKLQGRIEQIFGQDPEPPLKELDAKPQVLDPRLVQKKNQPQIIPKQLKSFPITLRGDWKGTLTVIENECTHDYWNELPVEAKTDQEFFHAGKSGQMSLRFYCGNGSQLSMDTPEVAFPITSAEKRELNMKGSMIYLETSTDTGPTWSSNSSECTYEGHLIKNKVCNVTANTVEQDTLVDSIIVNRKTGKKNKFYTEHVFQFEKLGPFQLHVHVAEALFGPNRKIWRRMLLEGTLH